MTNRSGSILSAVSYLPLASEDMASSNSSDVVILAVGVILAAVYLFRDQLFSGSKSNSTPVPSANKGATANGSSNPRDFVTKMKEGVSLSRYTTYCGF